MKFGERLRSWRGDISQAELERRIKKGRAYINRVETNELLPPDKETCEQIADALGIDKDELWDASARERLERFDPDVAEWHRVKLSGASEMKLSEEERRIIALLRKGAEIGGPRVNVTISDPENKANDQTIESRPAWHEKVVTLLSELQLVDSRVLYVVIAIARYLGASEVRGMHQGYSTIPKVLKLRRLLNPLGIPDLMKNDPDSVSWDCFFLFEEAKRFLANGHLEVEAAEELKEWHSVYESLGTPPKMAQLPILNTIQDAVCSIVERHSVR